MPRAAKWTPDRLAIAEAARMANESYEDIAAKLSRAGSERFTAEQVRTALRDRRLGHTQRVSDTSPSEVLPIARTTAANTTSTHAPPVDAGPSVDDIVALAQKYKKRGGLTVQLAADELDLSPRRTIELFQRAQREGRTIDFAHGEIVWRPPESPRGVVAIAPPKPGDERAIGVFSDVHAGSIYHLGAELGLFVNRAYDAGVRDFFCPGDVVEGCYKHARWELSAQSQEDQHEHFLAALPMRPGMRVWFIDGNHDFTWTEKNGSESGRALVRLAREMGRNDLHFLGSRGALVDYGGTRIELWHPKKGAAYALSYQLQNKIRDTAIDRLPDILLTGHTHQYVKLRRQNVWAFYCGTFQHGDGPYGRSLGGDTAMGGLIIRWRKDPDGVVRRLSDEFQAIDRNPRLHRVEAA